MDIVVMLVEEDEEQEFSVVRRKPDMKSFLAIWHIWLFNNETNNGNNR